MSDAKAFAPTVANTRHALDGNPPRITLGSRFPELRGQAQHDAAVSTTAKEGHINPWLKHPADASQGLRPKS